MGRLLSTRFHLLAIVALALATGCGSGDSRAEPAIAEAFAGPVQLKLREEIHPDSKTSTTVEHGTRLDVLQIRRRFVRVRTPAGRQGWTEMRNLMNEQQMKQLAELAEYAKSLPSQGQATVYEPLNVHTEPSRPATSFYQIVEGIEVDVVDHRLIPRTNQLPDPAIQIRKPDPPRRVRKKKAEPKTPPPPKPSAPGVPADWLELSRTNLPPPPPEPEPPKPATPSGPLEDWMLVRTSDGRAGWVLARNLVMAIPDEVAQYSEGARITSYFPLKQVQDGEETKRHWLWTTMRGGGKPYQFDGFRVFIYMVRRHRYETAWIARNVEGYYPVQVIPGETPRFTLIFREPGGELARHSYVLEGYNVRKIGQEPYKLPESRFNLSRSGPEDGGAAADPASDEEENKPSLLERLRGLLGKES